MDSMKYILLDFDGVLTSVQHTRACRQERCVPNIYGLDWFDPACLDALRTIVVATGAGIVVSSSRRDLGDEKLLRVWEHIPMPGEFIGTTPIWILTKREAIRHWIGQHPDDRFVILDDADQGFPDQVITDPYMGLTRKNAEEAVTLLNKE